jgi:TatA/E family protein of Tat protein translocase
VYAFILDSLGSTELLFIMVIALIFFGPRKLPSLARSMGKSLAEFRKASEDFKRTWEREVALESSRSDSVENAIPGEESADINHDSQVIGEPLVEPASPDLVVARNSSQTPTAPPETTKAVNETAPSEPLRKHDWF